MTEKIVPNLEAKASDGNPIFTPKQWLESFRQFTKREQNRHYTTIERRRHYGYRLDREGNGSPRRFHLGSGTGNPLRNNLRRKQNGSGQHKN